MIERIILIKLKEDFSDAETRREIADFTRRVFWEIPQVRGVQIRGPADQETASEWDLYLTVRFDRVDDISRYLANPNHRSYMKDFLGPKVQAVKGWNFSAA